MPDTLLNRENVRDESKALMGSGLAVVMVGLAFLGMIGGWPAVFTALIAMFGLLMTVIGYDTYVSAKEN